MAKTRIIHYWHNIERAWDNVKQTVRTNIDSILLLVVVVNVISILVRH